MTHEDADSSDPKIVIREMLLALKKTKKELSQIKNQLKEPIAIIGIGCRFPGDVNSPEDFWNLLQSGKDGIIDIPPGRWNIDDYYNPDKEVPGTLYTKRGGFLQQPIDQFDNDFFNVSPREALDMDPQQKLLLEVCYEALEHAGIPKKNLKGTDTGVYMGIMYNDYFRLLDQTLNNKEITAYYDSGNLFSATIGRLSYYLGVHGPCIPIDTACSSSLVAIELACQSLRYRQSALALAGGVNLTLKPESMVMECKANMLSPDGLCKTFDASADGFSHGEGCGVVILKRLSDALKDNDRVIAVIRGGAINHGGASSGLTVPNQLAEESLMQTALSNAQLKPHEIDFVEAHGTGTSLGDPIEVAAIASVYGNNRTKPLIIGSVKTNIGHTESAAGVAGLIKVALSLQNKIIPAHLHFKTLNPLIDLERIPAKIPIQQMIWETSGEPRRAAVSSFGFSGINAHLILEEYSEIINPLDLKRDRPLHILTISAETEKGLHELIERYKNFLTTTRDQLGDICYTANTGREHKRYRIALLGSDVNEIKIKLHAGDYFYGETTDSKEYVIENFGADLNDAYNRLAKEYIQGAIVDWKRLDEQYNWEKVTLPTYPFQRKRFWAKILDQNNMANETSKLHSWFYKIDWVEQIQQETLQPELERTFLAFTTKATFEQVLQNEALRFSLIEPNTVPFSLELLIELLNQNKSVTDVVFCSDFDTSGEALLYLIQALLKTGLTPRVWLLTHSAQQISGTEIDLQPSQNVLLGFGKVIALEHPEFKCVRIDYDNSLTQKQIFSEFNAVGNEDEVAYRDAKRFVPRLNQYIPTVQKPVAISSTGCYLITGGMGGIGLQCMEWLIEKGATNIILMGRSEPKNDVLERLNNYIEKGKIITLFKGDVSLKHDVVKLFEVISQNHFNLKGVIHAAGSVDNDFIAQQNWDRFSKVLAPKVIGTQNLDDALKDNQYELDFFVLFSSVSGVLGSTATSNYAAANYYLYEYAKYARSRGLPVISMAWGPWRDIGMAASDEDKESRLGYGLISPYEGMMAMEMALNDEQSGPIIIPMDWSTYFDNIPYIAKIYETTQPDQQQNSNVRYDELGLLLDNALQSDRILIAHNYIKKLVKEVLGLSDEEKLDQRKGFFEMGLDSLMAVELRNKVQTSIGDRSTLKSTLTFDYPNTFLLAESLLTSIGYADNLTAKSIDEENTVLINKNKVSQVEQLSDKEAFDALYKELNDE